MFRGLPPRSAMTRLLGFVTIRKGTGCHWVKTAEVNIGMQLLIK